MQHKDIEPLINCFYGSHKFHFLLLKCAVEPLIANVPQPVERDLCDSLTEKNGIDRNIIAAVALSEVVHKVADVQQVEGRITSILHEGKLPQLVTKLHGLQYPGRIVMIAMYWKYWYGDVEVWVFIIHTSKPGERNILEKDIKTKKFLLLGKIKGLIAQYIYLYRIVSKAIGSHKLHRTIQCSGDTNVTQWRFLLKAYLLDGLLSWNKSPPNKIMSTCIW